MAFLSKAKTSSRAGVPSDGCAISPNTQKGKKSNSHRLYIGDELCELFGWDHNVRLDIAIGTDDDEGLILLRASTIGYKLIKPSNGGTHYVQFSESSTYATHVYAGLQEPGIKHCPCTVLDNDENLGTGLLVRVYKPKTSNFRSLKTNDRI